MVFDGSGPFILPNSCVGVASVRKAITRVQGRIPLHAENGIFVLRTWEPEARLRKLGPPVRPLKEKELDPSGELKLRILRQRYQGWLRWTLRQTCVHVERTMSTWETKWLREASAMTNLSGVTNFVNLDDGTAGQIQRPGKLRTTC